MCVSVDSLSTAVTCTLCAHLGDAECGAQKRAGALAWCKGHVSGCGFCRVGPGGCCGFRLVLASVVSSDLCVSEFWWHEVCWVSEMGRESCTMLVQGRGYACFEAPKHPVNGGCCAATWA